MNTSGRFELKNGLSVLVDWVSFTLTDTESPETIINLLGYSRDDFFELPKGRSGYRSMLKCFSSDVYILYSGNEGMGVHADITGSAVSEVLEHFCKKRTSTTPFGSDGYLTDSVKATVLSDLFRAILDAGGSFSRVDLAVDDFGANYFTMPELCDIAESESYSSRFQGGRIDKGIGKNKGCTIYFGSRSSDIMLRIYDKQAEQNKNARSDSRIDSPWVRWELELKNDYATRTARFIMDDMLLGNVVFGILSTYLRLIVNNRSRKHNCTTLPKWESFLGGVMKLSLYQRGEPKTIDNLVDWFYKQVTPSLAVIAEAYDGDMRIFTDMLVNGRERLTKHHQAMIDAFRIQSLNNKEVFA